MLDGGDIPHLFQATGRRMSPPSAAAAVAGDAENKRIQTQVLKMKNPSTSRVRGWWGQNCGRGEEEEEEVGPVPRE